jgi:hypothetical protein
MTTHPERTLNSLSQAESRPIALLPTVSQVDQLPRAELSVLACTLTALLAHITLRLQSLVTDRGDEVEAFDVREAARRIGCSVDVLREHGEEWGVALVLTRDKHGRPTRVVYPRARVRAFLERRGPQRAYPATETAAA